MKLIITSVLLPLIICWACRKPVDPAVDLVSAPSSNTAPVSTTSPVSTSTPARATVPYDTDLYAQFATPFAASSTKRLKQISVYKDTSLIATSVFSYDQAGLLASRVLMGESTGGKVSQVLAYTYSTGAQLIRESATLLTSSGSISESPSSVTDYGYTNGVLTSTTRQSKVSFYPLSLNSRTTYRYIGKTLTRATVLTYYSPLCSCNTPYPGDSTQQLFSDLARQATRIDSVWSVCPPTAACSSRFSRQVITRTERDSKGNTVLVQTNVNNLAPASYVYSHQYDGPDGLLSSSTNQTLGIRYSFSYESK